MPDLQEKVPRHPVGQLLTYKDHPENALVDLGRDASAALRASLAPSRPFDSGGAIDSAWLLPTLGAGSTAASSLIAGNVFLATANPATLMTIAVRESDPPSWGRPGSLLRRRLSLPAPP